MAIEIQTLPALTGIGAATALGEHIAVSSVTIQSQNDNVGSVYVGDSTVTISTGLIIDEGDATIITADMIGSSSEEFYLDEIFVISATAGNTVRVAAFRRRTT